MIDCSSSTSSTVRLDASIERSYGSGRSARTRASGPAALAGPLARGAARSVVVATATAVTAVAAPVSVVAAAAALVLVRVAIVVAAIVGAAA